MALSRMRRLEEKRLRKRLILAIVGSVGIIAFLLLFGVKLLINFSLTVDKIRGASTPTPAGPSVLLPPVLDPLPEATFSANLTVTGHAQSGKSIILFVNDQEKDTFPIDSDGTFTAPDTHFTNGDNTVSAKAKDDKGNASDLSNVLHVLVKTGAPPVEVTAPEDGAQINGDPAQVSVEGKVDEDTTVTVNDRLVVVEKGGSFHYTYPLQEGETTLHIVATDQAGNTATVDRRVEYHK